MRIDLVVFDVAGTTVYDGDAVHACLGGALLDAGVTATRDQINAVMGTPKPIAIATRVSDPRRVAKVGDTPADLREGHAAGCALVVGVTNGSHDRDELARHPHTHLVDDLAAILPLLESGGINERAPGNADVPLLFTPGPLTPSHAVKAAMMADVGSRDEEVIR